MKTIISLSIALLSFVGLSAQCVAEFDYTFNQSVATLEGHFYPDGNMIPNPAIQVTYSWSIGGSTLSGEVVTHDFGQDQCLVVVLTATGDGCTTSVYDSVFNPNYFIDTCNMFLSYNISPADDNQTSNGAIDITVQGGTAPFAYDWSNQATTEDISGLFPGTYSVEVTDDMGCVLVQSFDVPINDSLNPINTFTTSAWYSFNNADCTATVTADVYGGTPPYSYQWSNQQTTQSFSGGCDGDLFCVTVTDALGAIANACVSLYYVQDTSGTVTNTLQSAVDTCMDVLYGEIADYLVNDSTIVVTWEFVDNQQVTSYITISYPVEDSIVPGTYDIFLLINCDDLSKSITWYSDRIIVTQDDILMIDMQEIKNDYAVYPNPVSDKLYIDFDSRDFDNTELLIYNTAGQIIINTQQHFSPGQNTFGIDVSNLPKGVYFVKITGEKTYETKKFIK